MKETQTTVRSITPTERGAAQEQPLYAAQPAAGFPAPGDDMVEKPLDLNDLLIDNPSATFFVRVTGDSMEGAKIFDGDILVVDRSIEAKAGSIVVAAVYGELVVKRVSNAKGQLALTSEQAGYAPIFVDNEGDDCFIWGVVTGSARILN